jgi:hypothetical protein
MNNGTKLELNTDINGQITISNDRTRITISSNGSIAISSYDPIELTGASLAKLDDKSCTPSAASSVKEALLKRLEKKTSN